jgi:hypothetical protein
MLARFRGSVVVAIAVCTVALSLARGVAQAAPADPEVTARQDFAAGRYQEAIEIYAQLYAEKPHPTYLRNIGRCYQALGDPDRALAAFREYLRRLPDLAPDKKAEIDAYIAEMEALKAKRAAEAEPHPAAPKAPEAPAAQPVVPTPSEAAAASEASSPPESLVTQPEEQSPSLVHRPLFWVAVGAVVVAAVAVTLVATVGRSDTYPTPSLGSQTF